MTQTILSEKQSTGGSPYAFYTVEVTPKILKAIFINIFYFIKRKEGKS